TRRTALRSSDFPLRLSTKRSSGSLRRSDSTLPVGVLADLVLFELFVEVAARRADHFGGLRDVPAVLAQLADQEHPLGVLLELAQRPRLRLAGAFGGGGLRRGRPAAKPAGAGGRRRA